MGKLNSLWNMFRRHKYGFVIALFVLLMGVVDENSLWSRYQHQAELAELLDLQASASRKETAVTRLRPSAIRDAARMTTFQTAIAWRYGRLLEAVDRHAAIMDTAFNFTPLMMTQGDALIMPPVLTRAGASMRIDDDGTATTASASAGTCTSSACNVRS